MVTLSLQIEMIWLEVLQTTLQPDTRGNICICRVITLSRPLQSKGMVSHVQNLEMQQTAMADALNKAGRKSASGNELLRKPWTEHVWRPEASINQLEIFYASRGLFQTFNSSLTNS
jgi:hypothetical protein